jgi:hypothetical protein
MSYDFGLTNNKARVEAAAAWREAAINDGWEVEPLYPKHEEISSACRLTKDGFVAQILTREFSGTEARAYRYQAEVHVWGSDRLVVDVPYNYPGFEAIQKLQYRCNYCKTENVPTQRVNFAGRCCEACLPAQRKRTEFPGWCD